MANAMGPSSENHRPLLGSPDPGPMYRMNVPLIGPACDTNHSIYWTKIWFHTEGRAATFICGI